MTKALVPTYPPVPQPMESVTEPERLMALHYADVWHCLQSMQQRTNGIELLFGSAVVAGFKVDIETALDHLRSVWGHAAAAINEGRAEG